MVDLCQRVADEAQLHQAETVKRPADDLSPLSALMALHHPQAATQDVS
jgi:hypothetical protein